MIFKLNEEQELLRKIVRDFAESEIAPKAAEMDEKEEYDYGLWAKMAEMGLTHHKRVYGLHHYHL